MYGELYEVWKKETGSAELEKLPSDFYPRIANYLRNLREEGRMLDKRLLKARLLTMELRNARRMLQELTQTRCRKLMLPGKGDVIPDVLAPEERQLSNSFTPLVEAYYSFARDLLRGHLSRMTIKHQRAFAILRFLKDVPAIIGADMKAYGPFRAEDVGSLPVDNAQILVKQGLAERVGIH
jgi:DNA replication factor GINS